MSNLAEQLNGVIARRHEQLPEVERLRSGWTDVRSQARALVGSIKEAAGVEALDDAVVDAALFIEDSRVEESVSRISEQASVVAERFSRETVNIGMSGAARVGKSTLLQTISGLGDDQIPTGEGRPVTAVRSQIYNTPDRAEAVVNFYSWPRFVSDVLKPLHEQLRIPTTPVSSIEWRTVDYRSVDVESDKSGEAQAALTRCIEMQSGIGTFDELFGRPPETIDLQRLRPYVAYPRGASDDRLYAAVDSAFVYCQFPRAAAARLGLVDLPGLGEISPGAEARHVRALANDVDIVLIVKRPGEESSFWRTEDGRAFKLIQDARGAISRSSDFTAIVINAGGTSETLEDHLRTSIDKDAPTVPVFEVDGADSPQVQERLLVPLLQHLAARLPVMDGEILGALKLESTTEASSLLQSVRRVREALSAPMLSGSAEEELADRISRARLGLADDLVRYESELHGLIKDDEAQGFVEEVKACYQSAIDWVDGEAFADEDVIRIAQEMRLHRGSGGVAADELSRIRVEVSERYAAIDAHFAADVRRVAERIRDILITYLGSLVPSSDDPILDLLALADRVDHADEPSPNFADALREFSGTSFTYRTQFYPYVRDVINTYLLAQWRDPATGELDGIGPFEMNESGARSLIRELRSRGRQVAYQSQQELLDRAETPARLMHAVTEHFTDRLLRHPDSQREFARVARSYRDDLWPGVFEEFLATRAVSAQLRANVDQLQRNLEYLAGEAK